MTDYESKPPSIGMWAGTSERGPVATGNCGAIRFVLWKNTKGGPNAPDYRLVMEQAQKRDSGAQTASADRPATDTRQGAEGAGGGAGGFPDDGGDGVPF